MRKDRIAFSHGRSSSLVPHSVHCDESAWKDRFRVGRTSLLGCCKSLLRPSPTPKMRKIHSQPLASSPKKVWLCSFMEGLGCILPSGQAVRGFQHDSVPHFSTELVHSVAQKPPSFQVLCPRLLTSRFTGFFLWFFELTVRTVQCQAYFKLVVRASRVFCRDAVPTKVAHALNCSSSNPSPTVAVTQLSPSERRGRCPSFDLLEEASRTLSVHER